MMRRMLTVTSMAAALVLGSTAVSLRAAPLESADVAAGAKWLVHIDFDAARESKIGEHFLTQAMKDGHAKERLEKLHDELGIDLQKDLHGATAYATDFTPHSGVLIVHGTADKDKLVSYLKAKPDFAESKSADGGHDLYSWTENMGHGDKHTVWASFPKAGVAVVAESAENMNAALDVIGGKGGLATSSPLLADLPKGSIISGAVVGLTAAKLPIQAPLAKQIDDVHLAIGEGEGEAFAHVKVETTDASATKQMKSMIDGFRGMIALQAGDHPEVQKMLNDLKVEAQDKALTIDWKASSDELIKAGDKAREAARKQRQ